MKLLGPALASLLLSIATIGCSQPAGSEDAEPVEESEDELVASCTYPRRFAAILTDGECTPVAAKRGQWVPSPVFEDAPEIGACIYSWVGERKGVRVDRPAIQNWAAERGVLTAMCGSGDDGLDPANVLPIAQLSIYGLAGSVGCDVCGLLKGNRVWIVIPPERDIHGEFQLPLNNGAVRNFSIQADRSASVMSIALPAPPAGAQYVSGRFPIY